MNLTNIIENILLSVCFLLNLSFGTAILFRPLESRVTSNLIAHQSLIDAILCLINLLLNLIPEYINDLHNETLNRFVCHVWTTQWVYWHFVQMSVQNLVCISLDRYIAVVKASIYREKQRFILIFSYIYVWSVSTVINLQGAFQFVFLNNSCEHVSILKSNSINNFYIATGFIWFLVCYLLPTLFFIYAYSHVIKVIRQLKSSGNENRVGNKLTISAFIITCFFIVLFSYDTIYYLLGYMKVVSYIYGTTLQKVGVLLITMNSFVSTIVCLIVMRSMRQRYLTFYGDILTRFVRFSRHVRVNGIQY